MSRPIVTASDADEFADLIFNAVLCALDDKRRVYVAGPYRPLCAARKMLRGDNKDLPPHVDFHELEPHELLSTTAPTIWLRSELAILALGRKTALIAVVPHLRMPASIMPLIETCRLATAGATLFATLRDAAMIPAHLVTPAWRNAA